MIHALNQEDAKHRIFELGCFTIGAAIFEHFGILALHYFSYDQRRIMMIGVVPLGVILTEAVIVYAAFRFFEYLRMPKWTAPFIVGFLSMLQDMTYDPVAVHDTYLLNGSMSGQWNWVWQYDDSYFGIPFYNFTGWFLFCGIYPALLLLGRHLYKKNKNEIWGYAYSYIAGFVLLIPTVLFGMVFSSGNREIQLVKMIALFVFGMVLLAIAWKRMDSIDIRKDYIIFLIPIVLSLYDIIVCFSLKISEAYVPCVVFSVIHFIILIAIFIKSKNTLRS